LDWRNCNEEKGNNLQIFVCCLVTVAILALVPGNTFAANNVMGEPAFFEISYTEPFYQPKDKSDPLRAGDIAIQLRDRNGKPTSGIQLVFLYVKAGSPLDNILTNDKIHYGGYHNDVPVKDIWQEFQKLNNARPVGIYSTGLDGTFHTNYLWNLTQNFENFVDKVKKGVIQGDIGIACITHGLDAIVSVEKIPVVLPGVAKLERVKWLGEDKDGKPGVKIERPLFDMSRPYKIIVTDKMVPYYLLPGERIVLEQDDFVKVVWLTGTRIKAMPKSDVSEAILEIAGKGTTWWIETIKSSGVIVAGFTLSGVGLALNIIAYTGSLLAGGLGIAVAFVGVVVASAGIVEHRSNPLFLEIYSNVLMDINGDTGEVAIHLVEGNCILTEDLGNPGTKITTGQQVTVDKDLTSLLEDEGVASLPKEAKETQVPEATQGIIDEKETQVPEAIKGLTFESRSKPNGSEVQIPLALSGISEQVGNLDMTLTYDPDVLEAIEVTSGSLTLDSIMEYKITTGNIKIALADGDGFLGDGSIIYVRFNVIGSPGQSSSLNITESSTNNVNYDLIQLQNNNGTFRVIDVNEARGDFDGNGQLTAVDALGALQMAVGKRPVDLSLDMNDDGQVTSLDARTILKIAVGNN
jgi:hypothetical protein